MVKQVNTNVASEIDKLNEQDTLAVLEYVSRLLSINNSIPAENKINDELIASLSEKRENQRALQVIEWEKTRRQNQQRAA